MGAPLFFISPCVDKLVAGGVPRGYRVVGVMPRAPDTRGRELKNNLTFNNILYAGVASCEELATALSLSLCLAS